MWRDVGVGIAHHHCKTVSWGVIEILFLNLNTNIDSIVFDIKKYIYKREDDPPIHYKYRRIVKSQRELILRARHEIVFHLLLRFCS